ncbi:sensor histidine kinase N-terminal domain-containing protein [Limibaculum sp. M0105]|uniref:histidine kinase n=1 Tax=Thermohalobaculum xanthum TaxID=2753746 RepID=A0A8J7SEG9_9RHOB|nr:sensor histidine kinase [Thermohalobaculum xanthum]MBK0399808.1 sensor histidine kinase N-terminal domain-containing protein [Thermohalobaculum xanthum]
MTERAPSIAVRLGLAVALVLAVGGLGAALAALAYGREAAREAYDRLLAGAAFDIARSVSVSAGAVAVDIPVSAFELLALAPEDRVVYRVIDREGATVTGYDLVPPPPRASQGAEVAFYGAEFGGEPVRLAAVRRRFAERAYSGEVAVVVGHTLRARSTLAWDIARKAMWLAAAGGLCLVVLTAAAVRSALGPLRRVEAALAGRRPEDLSPLDVETPREIRATVGAINGFMARLARRMDAMQAYIADAAHQLRTPVAALSAQAELAAEEADPERLRALAARIRGCAAGLGRLTDQLLNQALVMHRADAVPREELDLRMVAIRVAEASDHDLASTPEDLRLDLPEDRVSVEGDALSLIEATKNLVNNALRYGVPPVTITVRAPGAIDVTDRGAGLPEATWEQAGQRFARSEANAQGGAGIGLAIVRAVAEAHGGRMVFSRPARGGFRATLDLGAAALGDGAKGGPQ